MDKLFKGQQKPTPHMGVPEKKGEDNYCSPWWGNRPQWQPGKVPAGGFNPVYRANDTQPVKHPEETNNFSIRKPKE